LRARCTSGSSSWPVRRSDPISRFTLRSGFRLRQQDARAGVLQRPDAVQHAVAEHHAILGSAAHHETADPQSRRGEDLNALATIRRVGDDKRAVGRHGERGRIDDAARFGADLHDLPRARLLFVEPIDGVAAAIEDEVLAGGGLLKAGDFAEAAGDVGGDGAR
jgi:hypothetical protein